jgi:predicted  nucleic acid-binding Zn-ribbon protein
VGGASLTLEVIIMATKEEYLAKLKTQLDSWQVEVDALEAKASDAMDDMKPEIDAQIANLKVKFAEGEGKFNELADATEEAWEELKVDAEAMFDNLIGDFKEDLEVAATEAKGLFAKIMSAFK